MSDLEDKYLDKINEYLHARTVPNDSIKKMMFYFKIISNIVDYDFKENFTNYHNPYFKSNEEMNSFVALAQKLNPSDLQSLNVLIICNDKSLYNAKDDDPLYEYKIINPKLAKSPQFLENYKNSFNIYNIDTTKNSIVIKENDKLEFSEPFSIDENYYDEAVENQPTIDTPATSPPSETPEQAERFEKYRKRFNRKRLKKLEKEDQEHYIIPIADEEEEPSNQPNEPKASKAKVMNKLLASSDWIHTIYDTSFTNLYNNMKVMEFEEDRMRTKSITLPRNIFFYLSIVFLIVLFSCACVMINAAKTLNDNDKFWLLGGQNRTSTQSVRSDEPNHSFAQILSGALEYVYHQNLLLKTDINYSNDTVIVQNNHAFYVTKTANDLAITTGVFSIFFVLFICYMWIRVAREQKEALTKKPTKNVGINLIHVVVLLLFTLVIVVVAIVGEGYAAAGFIIKTYDFIHSKQCLILEMNSIIIVCYVLIFLFYFKH